MQLSEAQQQCIPDPAERLPEALHQGPQHHGPLTLQQTIADNIQAAAFDAGSSDNLAAVVLDISPQQSGPASSLQASPACTVSAASSVSVLESQETGCDAAQAKSESAQTSMTSSDLETCEHAVRAELPQETQPESAEDSELPGVTLWPDSSQMQLGSIVGRAADGSSHYKLLQQLAELPRFADHIHTSWAGLPVLSSMSLWLQPHLPSHATSHCLTPPHLHTDGFSSETPGLPHNDQADSSHQTSSQVMLSPGTMLQLIPRDLTIPTSQDRTWTDLWGGDSPWFTEAGDDEAGSDSPHSTEVLVSTATAIAQITSGMFSEAPPPSEALPDDAVSQHVERAFLATNASSVQHAPSLTSAWQHDVRQGWQKYGTGGNFARGSFGEVWRAETVHNGRVGQVTAHPNMKLLYISDFTRAAWPECLPAFTMTIPAVLLSVTACLDW